MVTEIGVNPHSESILTILTNMTVDGTIDLFNPQVVILEVILYQWSTQTVMGTEIGINPHSESILTIFMSLT